MLNILIILTIIVLITALITVANVINILIPKQQFVIDLKFVPDHLKIDEILNNWKQTGIIMFNEGNKCHEELEFYSPYQDKTNSFPIQKQSNIHHNRINEYLAGIDPIDKNKTNADIILAKAYNKQVEQNISNSDLIQTSDKDKTINTVMFSSNINSQEESFKDLFTQDFNTDLIKESDKVGTPSLIEEDITNIKKKKSNKNEQ